MSHCTIENCPNAAVAKGLCPQHYMRVRRTGSATAPPAKPGPKPKKPPGNGQDAAKLDALAAEIARLKTENAALRQPRPVLRPVLHPRTAEPPKPPPAPQQPTASAPSPSPDVAALQQQIDSLTRERDNRVSAAVYWERVREVDRLTKELAASRVASGLDTKEEKAVAAALRARDAAQQKQAEAEARLADDPGPNGKLARLLKAEQEAHRRTKHSNTLLVEQRDEANRKLREKPVAGLSKGEWRALKMRNHPVTGKDATEAQLNETMRILNKLGENLVPPPDRPLQR